MEIGRSLSALLAGLLFGVGLAVSGMIDPARVLGFLDLAALAGPGIWDPTLAFTMAGALLVAVPGFALLRRQSRPVFGARFDWPNQRNIDQRLLLGSALFGAGWGLVGFCPGPAISALSGGFADVVLFVAAMLAGMALHRYWEHR